MIEMIRLLLNKGYIYDIKYFDKIIFIERGMEGIYQNFPLIIGNNYKKSLNSFFQMKIKYI